MQTEYLTRYIETVLAVAQAGLTYSKDRFDRERFEKLQQLTAQLIAEETTFSRQDITDWIALDKHYPTPKLDVRAVIFDNRARILLVQESSDRCWTLPGGWCDIGESPSAAVAREVLEETGLHVLPVRLLALFDKLKHSHPPQIPHAYKAFFHCTILHGNLLQHTDETEDAGYFERESLPELSQHRVIASQIQTLCQRIESGQIETLFD